jgi:hypothetical protein
MHLCINAAAAFYPYLSHLKASYKPPADATNARCGYPEPLFVCEATGVVYGLCIGHGYRAAERVRTLHQFLDVISEPLWREGGRDWR